MPWAHAPNQQLLCTTISKTSYLEDLIEFGEDGLGLPGFSVDGVETMQEFFDILPETTHACRFRFLIRPVFVGVSTQQWRAWVICAHKFRQKS